MKLTRRLMTTSSLALLAGCATREEAPPAPPPAPPRPPAQIGAWGVDLSARDLSVKPGDDFFRYSNGTWLANSQIPPDRTRWGSFDILRDKADRDQRAIVEGLTDGAPGSNAQKVSDFYSSYLNQDAIDAKGLTALQADIAQINAARTHAAIVALMAKRDLGANAPIALGINQDQRNPDRYIVTMTHSGIGMPEREYYRRTDGEFPNIRTAYVAHIERCLTLAGQTGAAAKARTIMALETRIAELHWAIADRRERSRTYNLKTRAEVTALAPRFPWAAGFEACGLADTQEVVVRELSAIGPLANLVTSTPVSTWRTYLIWHLVNNNADVLPRAFDEASFQFYGRTLNGQPEQRERWKRAIDAVNTAMGEALGELYVQRHFPPESKAQMLALVENLRRAYDERIQGLEWMSPETKVAAREKLALFRPKIGYPDKWRDYSALEVRAGDAYANAMTTRVFNWNYNLGRLRRPTDRDEWRMTPQTVNATYSSTMNDITFPAAILQPPFFDPNADPAVNYGGIGGVIGHEMGHGFDDQGAKSDGRGVLRDWWGAHDVEAFAGLVARLAAQYDTYEPLPGIHVNGRLTSGENIGDNGGLQVSLHAYRLSLNGAQPETLDGLNGDQRFFLGWAQVWRSLIRDGALRNQVLTDPHSPAQYRVNGTVRNMDAWYGAYGVQPGDKLYLADDQRVKIW